MCAIGRQRVFSLGRWASRIHAGFHVSDATWDIAQGGSYPSAYRPITFCGGPFQNPSARIGLCNSPGAPCGSEAQFPLPPPCNAQGLEHRVGLGYSRFARHYSGNRGFFLLLGLLRCFSSPRSCPGPMYSAQGGPAEAGPGSPMGYLRINGCYPLPGDFRSLPRPSSLLAPKHPPHTLSSLTAGFCTRARLWQVCCV